MLGQWSAAWADARNRSPPIVHRSEPVGGPCGLPARARRLYVLGDREPPWGLLGPHAGRWRRRGAPRRAGGRERRRTRPRAVTARVVAHGTDAEHARSQPAEAARGAPSREGGGAPIPATSGGHVRPRARGRRGPPPRPQRRILRVLRPRRTRR